MYIYISHILFNSYNDRLGGKNNYLPGATNNSKKKTINCHIDHHCCLKPLLFPIQR